MGAGNENIDQSVADDNDELSVFRRRKPARESVIDDDFVGKFKSMAKEQSWGLLTLRQITEVMGKQVPKLVQRYLPIFSQYETDQNMLKAEAGEIAASQKEIG